MGSFNKAFEDMTIGELKELTRKYEEMQNELEQARFDLREKEARE